jgi:hypothetical protein
MPKHVGATIHNKLTELIIGVFVGFHAYINEMHDSRSKISSKKSRPYIYDIKFLASLGAPYTYMYIYMYICDISRLRVKSLCMFRALLAHLKEAFTSGTWFIVCVLCQLAAPGAAN